MTSKLSNDVWAVTTEMNMTLTEEPKWSHFSTGSESCMWMARCGRTGWNTENMIYSLQSSRAINFHRSLKHMCIAEKVFHLWNALMQMVCLGFNSNPISTPTSRALNRKMSVQNFALGWSPYLLPFVTVSSIIRYFFCQNEHGCLVYKISKTEYCPFTRRRENVGQSQTHTHTVDIARALHAVFCAKYSLPWRKLSTAADILRTGFVDRMTYCLRRRPALPIL